MDKSDYLVGFLNSGTQKAYANRKAKAGDDPTGVPPNVALLKRVQRVIFSANVKTLEEASSRLATIIESLENDEEDAVE